jgi:hypothetical protein
MKYLQICLVSICAYLLCATLTIKQDVLIVLNGVSLLTTTKDQGSVVFAVLEGFKESTIIDMVTDDYSFISLIRGDFKCGNFKVTHDFINAGAGDYFFVNNVGFVGVNEFDVGDVLGFVNFSENSENVLSQGSVVVSSIEPSSSYREVCKNMILSS